MKLNNVIFKTFGLSLLATAFVACSSDEQPEALSERTALEVMLEPITRASVEGKTLPEWSNYGISFCESSQNVAVTYANGKSTVSTPVYLDENEHTVYAYYPYKKDMGSYLSKKQIYIGGDIAEDILVGTSYSKVSETQKVAKIIMKHVKSSIVFNFKLDEQFRTNGYLSKVLVSNVNTSGYYDFATDTINAYQGSASVSVGVNLKTVYKSATSQLLLLPTNLTGNSQLTVFVDNAEMKAALPVVNWESGKRYTYDVTIHGTSNITISNPQITPWQNGGSGDMSVVVEVKK